jgi:hypothetical protein
MPETINQTIPTQDELKLRESEPAERLLGESMDTLASSGQRLDFINKAEEQAHGEYSVHLLKQANDLLSEDGILSETEKNELSTLATESATKFTELRQKIEELQNKHQTAIETAQQKRKEESERLPEPLRKVTEAVKDAAVSVEEKAFAQEVEVRMGQWLTEWQSLVDSQRYGTSVPESVGRSRWDRATPRGGVDTRSKRESRVLYDFPSFGLIDFGKNIDQDFFVRYYKNLVV